MMDRNRATRAILAPGLAVSLALSALLLSPQAARAAAPCDAPETQVQMNECAGADYKAADKALNEAYREILADLRKTDEEQPDWGLADAFRDSQRAWLPFRDSQCSWEALLVKGGSIEPLIRLSCLAEMTNQRTKQMRETWNSFR
ncbi:MAG: lysozyme inhibitor LprI family protein [Proteobacteria bacterium]|nr:lysozyme inhibitor LprI family protein [Pseudomonadota bacterium]